MFEIRDILQWLINCIHISRSYVYFEMSQFRRIDQQSLLKNSSKLSPYIYVFVGQLYGRTVCGAHPSISVISSTSRVTSIDPTPDRKDGLFIDLQVENQHPNGLDLVH